MTPVAKALLNGLAFLVVLPSWALYALSSSLLPRRRTQFFQSHGQFLSLVPGTLGVYLRRAFYRRTLACCPNNCFIGFGTLFSSPDARIGQNVYIGPYCMIGVATIGDDTLLGSNVDILSGRNQHHIERIDIPIRLQGGTFERVTVGRDVWIGNGARILADVADQAVVAAGSVVAKPVAERSIVGGNPARPIGTRGAAPHAGLQATETAAPS